MATVTKTSWTGLKTGEPIDSRYRAPFLYYEDETTVVASTSTAICALDVAGLDEIAFQICNSGSQTLVIKIYATLDKDMPATTADVRWKQVGSTVNITTGTSSEPQVFDNIYCWFYIDAVSSTAPMVTTQFLMYVNGKRTPP